MNTYTEETEKTTEIGWIANLIEKIIEFVFGITIGAAIGWYGGKIVGSVYVRYFGPAHLPGTEEVLQWCMMPLTFAKEGILIGAIGGILMIALIEYRTFAEKTYH
jgi:ABC-type antimicrobial peptide transport system permease subunit